jgi:uncharacterized protein (TIGR02466 family)
MEVECCCHQVFGVPIYTAVLNNISDEYNETLKRVCYEHVGKYPHRESEFFSYTSFYDTNLVEVRELDFFREEIERHVYNLLCSLGVDDSKVTIKISSIWFNVSKTGQMHMPHTHQNATFAGVYYIDIPEDAKSDIMFINTVSRSHTLPMKSNTSNFLSVSYIEPACNKKLVIFENWVVHAVAPNNSKKDRLGIAFNVIVHS